jgi:hypothetical protein
MDWVWDRNNYNLGANMLESFLSKIRQKCYREDIRRTETSEHLPHYAERVNGSPAFYLRSPLPKYMVTRIAQLRLNHNVILNQNKWINLGAFENSECKLCANQLSFRHVLTNCPGLPRMRLSPDLLTLEFYLSLHVFITESLRPFDVNCDFDCDGEYD